MLIRSINAMMMRRLERLLMNQEVINADGASVVLASKFLGSPIPERVAGIDLMQELLHLANEKGYSVYLFGAKEEVLTDMLAVFKKDYPNLQVVGRRNGYFSAEEEEIIQEDIRKKIQILSLSALLLLKRST